jgi:hypothetical protein
MRAISFGVVAYPELVQPVTEGLEPLSSNQVDAANGRHALDSGVERDDLHR